MGIDRCLRGEVVVARFDVDGVGVFGAHLVQFVGQVAVFQVIFRDNQFLSRDTAVFAGIHLAGDNQLGTGRPNHMFVLVVVLWGQFPLDGGFVIFLIPLGGGRFHLPVLRFFIDLVFLRDCPIPTGSHLGTAYAVIHGFVQVQVATLIQNQIIGIIAVELNCPHTFRPVEIGVGGTLDLKVVTFFASGFLVGNFPCEERTAVFGRLRFEINCLVECFYRFRNGILFAFKIFIQLIYDLERVLLFVVLNIDKQRAVFVGCCCPITFVFVVDVVPSFDWSCRC